MVDISTSGLVEEFHRIEQECVGYEDYINADEEHFLATIDGLKSLVENIQRESIFSSNEELTDI